jgi:hypothetical protein
VEEKISFEEWQELVKINLKKESSIETIRLFLEKLISLDLSPLELERALNLIKEKTTFKLKTLREEYQLLYSKRVWEQQRKIMQENEKIQEAIVDEEIEREAENLLRDPQLLLKANKTLEYYMTGDEENRIFLLLICEARKYSTQLIGLRGVTSAGKNHEVSWIPKLFSNVHVFSTTSAKYFQRKVLNEEIQTKGAIIIYLEEREGESGYEFEQLYGEEKIRIGVNVPSGREWVPVEIEIEGPVVYITTSTSEASEHRAAREWVVNPDESLEQTKRISLWRKWKDNLTQKEIEKYEREVKILKRALEKLKPYKKIIIPYRNYINFPFRGADDRRKEENFLLLIKLVSHFHQYQRPRDEKEGILISLPQDFFIAREVAEKILKISRGGLLKREEEVLEFIKKHNLGNRNEKGEGGEGSWFFISDCLQKEGCYWGYDTLRKTLNSLVRKGYLLKHPAGRGNLYKLKEENYIGESRNPTLISDLDKNKLCFFLKRISEDRPEVYNTLISQVPETFEYVSPFKLKFSYQLIDGFIEQICLEEKQEVQKIEEKILNKATNERVSDVQREKKEISFLSKEKNNIGVRFPPMLNGVSAKLNELKLEALEAGVPEDVFDAHVKIDSQELPCEFHDGIPTYYRKFDFLHLPQSWRPACLECVRKEVRDLIEEWCKKKNQSKAISRELPITSNCSKCGERAELFPYKASPGIGSSGYVLLCRECLANLENRNNKKEKCDNCGEDADKLINVDGKKLCETCLKALHYSKWLEWKTKKI